MALKDWKKIKAKGSMTEYSKIAFKKGSTIMSIDKEEGTFVVNERIDNNFKPWHTEGKYSDTLKYLKQYMRKH
jgi:hypothetical protein